MKCYIIDCGSGNLHSVEKAFRHVANHTGHHVAVTTQPTDLEDASHIVLPGVGAFADCMQGLHALDGMTESLKKQVCDTKKKFLGICVGMQMMLDESEEHGKHKGLDWIKGKVQAIVPSDPTLKIPHMGWNDLEVTATNHPVLKDIATGNHCYFVHSYYAVCDDNNEQLAAAEYGGSLSAIIGRENMIGTQFHPEKSGQTGLQLIENFMRW